MKHFLSILKALGITAGLDILMTGALYLFSHMVHRELGQALLFLTVTLLLITGVCLFAAIRVQAKGILWACMGVSFPTHLILSIVMTLTAGKALSDEWPGGMGNNLAQLLILLMSLAVWYVGIFAVTATRSRRATKAVREEKRQVKRAKKGYRKEWQTLTPARARLVAVLRGGLWVVWLHLLTTLLYEGLNEAGLEDTMLSYIAFPLLWSLMAARCVLYDRDRRGAYALSAAVSNLVFFLIPTALLTVVNTPAHKFRFVLHLDSILTEPLNNPEQMLVIGVFLTVWVAMIVFGIGHRKKKNV
ncbi:MAG: hypothetical protein IJ363_08085 [Clostridia bacterium]|nr:hypothetical protein [Clostridia bacterium]